MTQALLADLTEDRFRARPHAQNSIAWLLWHAARVEDVGVNRFAMDRPQVFDQGWDHKMGWPRRDVGTGMISDEVDELTRAVSMPAVVAYWDAVGEATLDLVRTHGSEGWDTPVDPVLIKQIVHEEGSFRPEAAP